MHQKLKLNFDTQRQLLLERASSSPLKPNWLIAGEYSDNTWTITDANPSSPKPPKTIRFDIIVTDPRRLNQTCRLTDPQYARLLDTVKRVVYCLRTGKYATVTTAKYQEEVSRCLIDLVQWMLLNGIKKFSNLGREDFSAYTEEAIYGPGYLLAYASRITTHIKSLKDAGKEIPQVQRSNKKPYLDSNRILEAAGIDPRRGYADKATIYELHQLAKAEDFYLRPDILSRIAAGPPKPEKLCHLRVLMMLLPWNYLWIMRSELRIDSLKFNPFYDTTPDQIARQLGKEMNRTKTVPVRQTMELIEFCLRWVLLYSPVLLDLRDHYDRLFDEGLDKDRRYDRMSEVITKSSIPEGPGSPFPINASTKRSQSEELNFGVAVFNFIPVACLIIIAAFTGRRHDEVLTLQAVGTGANDCISRDEYGLWIETYIEKLQVWDRTPCNELVVAAVDILRRWSAPARMVSGGTRLFMFKRLTSNRVAIFRPTKALKQFVDFLSITSMPDGTRWEFKPHQFRRFFAIMYFWHYQYRDLTALSYHLRHLNPEVTKLYVTERESGAIFRYVNKEYTTTILTEAALGERNISGPFGERFKTVVRQLRSRYRRGVAVISPKLVRKTVERFIEKSGRRLKAFKWGYCACGTKPQQLRTARCLEGSDKNAAVAPDLSRSSFSTCGDCPHHVTEDVFKSFWVTELELHERAAADSTNGPILCKASHEHTKNLRRLHERSFTDSKPLEELNGKPYKCISKR